ncbi:MAG TPA: glycine cleavage system aminomethyltransferase GcvT [Candidatus Limnocylindrales bacterium]|nr:glycine cleavage system aminomethyltransferase GcvT [Candidatus Limnocylindrales bacterium]
MSTSTVERTPLFDEHLRLRAQMTNFGGWAMPLQYSSIRDEHRAVREAAGLFDLSHMGEIQVRGRGALALVQRLVSRDIAPLKPGQIQYALFCNEAGGIIDDLLVYAESDGYLLVVNASNQERDYAWAEQHAGPDAEVRNVSRETALIGVQGPRAVEIVQRSADQDLAPVRYYRFIDGNFAGAACRFSRTGYTGEDGFEIFCRGEDAPRLWRLLLEQGAPFGLKPAGLGARDTLRLEAGMRLYGNDMDEQTNPLEAGLEWTVSLGKDFIGKPALERAQQAGLTRSLVGLRMRDRSIPRHGYPVMQGGKPVGTVTSGNVSFTLGYNIAMAYVPVAARAPGTTLEVQVRGALAPADVVPLPFYRRPHPSTKGGEHV